MSIIVCHSCTRHVDTDFKPSFIIVDKELCAGCFDDLTVRADRQLIDLVNEVKKVLDSYEMIDTSELKRIYDYIVEGKPYRCPINFSALR
jgi:hypothetical protein